MGKRQMKRKRWITWHMFRVGWTMDADDWEDVYWWTFEGFVID